MTAVDSLVRWYWSLKPGSAARRPRSGGAPLLARFLAFVGHRSR